MWSFFISLPERLKRITTGGLIIKEIDGLRFLAIFPVVLQHLCERFLRHTDIDFISGNEFEFVTFWTSRGFIGVYIFFVISGFVLAIPFASYYLNQTRKVSLSSYYLRRVTRLEPPYIIAMTIIMLGIVIMGARSFKEILPHFVASILYLHNLIYRGWTIVNPPAWTLEIEVQFYILAPLLAWLFFRIPRMWVRRTILVTSTISIICLQNYFEILNGPTKLTILGHLHYFLIGFLLADIFLNEWKSGVKPSKLFDVSGVLAFISLIYIWSWNHPLPNRIGFSCLLFILFFSVFRGVLINRFFVNKWITAIGGMCYTIYLIHLPLTEFFIRFTHNIQFTRIFTLNYLLQLLLFIPLIFLVSCIFYLLIEKPCMDKEWPGKLKAYLKRKISPA